MESEEQPFRPPPCPKCGRLHVPPVEIKAGDVTFVGGIECATFALWDDNATAAAPKSGAAIAAYGDLAEQSAEKLHAAFLEAVEREVMHWIGVLGAHNVYQTTLPSGDRQLEDIAGKRLSTVRVVAAGYCLSIVTERDWDE